MDSYAVSQTGMHRAWTRLENAAVNISRSASTSPRSIQTDRDFNRESPAAQQKTISTPIDYAREMTSVLEARIGYRANCKMAAVQSQLDKTVLDILA